MKKFLLLLCTLLGTVGAWATEINTVKTTLITSELAIESGKYYAFRVNGGSYITESEGQYVAPNAQNAITDAALFTLSGSTGSWKVRCKDTGSFWGTLTGSATGTFLPAGGPDAGEWTLTFSGNNVQAGSGGFFINRSSGVMHGWNTGINLQMYLVEDQTLNIATSLDEINPNKAYAISNSRGAWCAAADGSKIQGVSLDQTNVNQQFALVNYEEKLYIYNLGTKKFLGYDDEKGRDNSVLGAPTPITIAETADANYHWFFNFDESHNVNLSSGIIIIDSWTTHDAGNMNMLIEAADFDASEGIKAIMAANAQPGDDLTSFIVNPSFETGDMTGWTTVNSSDTGVKPNSNGTYATSGCDGQYLFNTWWKGNPITQTVTGLPNGKYELKVLVANDAGEGNADKPCIYLLANGEHAGPVAGTSKGTFAEGTIEFLVTNGTATIGVVGGNTDGSFREDGYYWYKCDNFRLTYLEALPSIDDVEIPEGKMSLAAEEGIEAAKASGDVVQLLDAVAVAKKSIEAYAKAADAIAAAKEILNSTNVPTEEATQGFAGAIEIFEDGYEAGNLSDEEAANAAATLGTAVTEWRAGANGESVKFLESAFDLPNGNFNVPLYVNTWSVEGENDGSNFKVPFYENFIGDDQSLAENRFETRIEGLTPGDSYEVSALIRTQLNKAASEQSETPYGISFGAEGGEPVDACADAEFLSSNLYLKEVTAVGTVDDQGVLTIYVSVNTNNVHWLSFKNIKYKKIVPAACVSVEDGAFMESTGNFVYQWTSGENFSPVVEITVPGGINNMDKRVTEKNFMMYSGRALSSPYDITLPMGFAIKGVTITATAASGAQTVACGDISKEFNAEAVTEFYMADPDGTDNTFEFVLSGSNTGLAVSSICIEYEEVGTADVTFKVVDKEGAELASTVQSVNVGAQVTEFAPEALRPFVTYEMTEAPAITEAGEYTWTATVKAMGGVYQIKRGENFLYGNGNVLEGALQSGETGEEDWYLWTVTGNPYETVQLTNNYGGMITALEGGGYAAVAAEGTPMEIQTAGTDDAFTMYTNDTWGFYPYSGWYYVADRYASGTFTANKIADLPEPLSPYDAALAAIKDGSYYNVFTEVDGEKYYLTGSGTLDKAGATAFKFEKVAGEEYEYGFKLNNSGTFFSNPPGTNESNLKSGKISTSTSGRNTWEAQVWFLNEEGYYAVRSTNAAAATSSWGWVGSSYWYVEEAATPIAQYQWDPAYVWQLEEIENPVNVTYVVYPAGSTESVGSATVIQDAGSEPVVPSVLKTKPFYKYVMDDDAYIGEEDVTINVTRDYVDGIVLKLEDFSNNKAYTVACDRGSLLTKDGYVASTAHGSNAGAAPAEFAVISYEDNFYLYSVADRKFMNFDPTVEGDGSRGPLADQPTHGIEDAIKLEAKAEPYFLTYFTAGGTNYGFNTNGNDPYGYVINTWMNADPGNQYYFIESSDFDPAEAIAALDAFFHPAEEPILEGIAALKNFEMPEGAESANVTLRLTDAKVTFVNTVEQTDIDWDTFEEITITKDNVVMEDASAATLLQGLGLNEALKAGDTVTGDIRFTVVSGMFGSEYVANDFTAESLTALEITEGEATPLAVTDDNVEAYAENYDYYYVEFADATYSISEDGDATINLPVMGQEFPMLDALQALTEEDYPETEVEMTARGYIVDYFGLLTYFQPISFEVPEPVVPVQITGTFDGMIKQILSHPLTGKQGEAKGEQTVTIAEGEEEGTYDITFSGFTMPVTGAVLPEFTVTGVEAEVSEDGGTATYSLPVWAPQTITIGRGTGSVTYDVKLEGTKSGEDAPVLKLTLTNSVVDDVYFGADEETIDAAIEADEATAISGINSINEAGSVFDLSGRKVEKIQRGGIYIVNGKKVSVK